MILIGVGVGAGAGRTKDAARELDHLELGAQARPDGAELQADNAATNDRERLGHVLPVQGARGADHVHLVDHVQREARRHADHGARRDDLPVASNLLRNVHATFAT